jgi:hypothetical protein
MSGTGSTSGSGQGFSSLKEINVTSFRAVGGSCSAQ